MKLRDFASRLTISPTKFTMYALNENPPKGKHKARVFRATLGYTESNYATLLSQIEAQALDAEATIYKEDQHGRHLQVDLPVIGIMGQAEMVRTGWLVGPNSDTALLSTLYVLGKES